MFVPLRAAAVLLLFTATLSAQDSTTVPLDHTTRDYDQKHLRLEIAPDIHAGRIEGVAELTVAPLVEPFRLLRLHSESTTIAAVEVAGRDCEFWHANGILAIDLGADYPADTLLTVRITYSAEPATGLYFFSPSEAAPDMPVQLWSQGQGEDNRHWIPCYDKPDDKLSSELIVTVPADLRVLSNGTLVADSLAGDRRIVHWRTGFEHSAYLITLVVGDYVTASDTLEGVALNYNVPRERFDGHMDRAFGRTPDMLAIYNRLLVPYPYRSYDQNAVQDFRYGGMENTTATTLNSRIFHDRSAEDTYSPDGLIAHELVHQWFGDLVTCRTWNHIWLNEGLTTYFTDVFFEHYAGKDEFRMRRLEQNRRYGAGLKRMPLDSLTPSPDGVSTVDLSGGRAYVRGAAIAHMLRYELGDTLFYKGMRTYLRRFAYGNADSEDLRHILESVSGRTLETFFRQWVYGAGMPHLKASWNWDAAARRLDLFIDQIQDTVPAMGTFELTVPLEIVAGKTRLTPVVRLSERRHQFSFPLGERPDMVRIDPGEWILKELTFEKSFEELRYQLWYDRDVVGRYRAAEQLARYPDDAVPVLKRALLREPFYGVRERIAETLGEIAREPAREALLEAVRDRDSRVRQAAATALGTYDGKNARKALEALLERDGNVYVQAAAAEALAEMDADGVRKWLRKLLERDSHSNILRRAAFDGYRRLQDPDLLGKAPRYVTHAMSDGGAHRLAGAVISYAWIFRETHRDRVVAVLEAALRNPYFRTRVLAARRLASLEARESLPLLREVLDGERRNFVRPRLESAHKALEAPLQGAAEPES